MEDTIAAQCSRQVDEIEVPSLAVWHLPRRKWVQASLREHFAYSLTCHARHCVAIKLATIRCRR